MGAIFTTKNDLLTDLHQLVFVPLNYTTCSERQRDIKLRCGIFFVIQTTKTYGRSLRVGVYESINYFQCIIQMDKSFS
jgi:hypothetical protein